MSAGAGWEKPSFPAILCLPAAAPSRSPRMNKPLAFILALFSWITLPMHAAELKRDIEYGRARQDLFLLDTYVASADSSR